MNSRSEYDSKLQVCVPSLMLPVAAPLQGGSARRIADKLENTKITNSVKVLLQLILKYAYMLDILIHQFDHIEFFDGTLPIFQNF